MPEKAPPPCRAIAAVGVDDDLAARQAGVTLGPSGHEAARGVDVHDRVAGPKLAVDAGQDDRLDDVVVDALRLHVRVVLRGDHDRVHAHRAVALVLHGHLGLAVRAQVVQLAALAHLGQPAGHAVGQRDGQGHELRRLAAGEAEHHALVAGAGLVVGRAARPRLLGVVHALGDVQATAP